MVFSLFKRNKTRPPLDPTSDQSRAPDPAAPVVPPLPPDFIDVRKLIARYDLAEHATRADDYFKSFTLDSLEFRKPFMSFDAAHLVGNLGVVLNNLDFFPGMRVLDFGCGPGWLARSLALMGCRPVALDVSKRALALGEQATRARYPEIVDAITYLAYDGHTIGLPDACMDRIICMDCFHHVPNQDRVLEEFYRILVPGGRVVFCEPGPHHSKTEESQYAMRHFDVIENDVLIDEIWSFAQARGFTDLKLSVWPGRTQQISLADLSALKTYDTAEPVLRRAYDEIYAPLVEGNRLFTLFKGEGRSDSRRREGLAGEFTAQVEDGGDSYAIRGTARNTGSSHWRASGMEVGSVNLGLLLRQADGTVLLDFVRVPLSGQGVAPGESASFTVVVDKARIGSAQLHASLIAEQVAWFDVDHAPRLL